MGLFDHRTQSLRKHPHSVLVRQNTGQTEAFPSGHHRQVASDLQEAKFVGYQEGVAVVRTSTGSVRHHSMEESAGGLAALQRVLARKRDNGQPAFMLKTEWEKLSQKERDALIVVPESAPPKPGGR